MWLPGTAFLDLLHFTGGLLRMQPSPGHLGAPREVNTMASGLLGEFLI